MALNTNEYGYIIDPLMQFSEYEGVAYLEIFQSGTTTHVLTYNDWSSESMNGERIYLDYAGRPASYIIGKKGISYKVVLCDSKHNVNDPLKTIDKIFPQGASVTTSGNIVQGLNAASISSLLVEGYVTDNTLTISDKNLPTATASELDAGQLLLKSGNQMKTLDGALVAKALEAFNGTYKNSTRDSVVAAGVYKRVSESGEATDTMMIVSAQNNKIGQTEIYADNYNKRTTVRYRYKGNDSESFSDWSLITDGLATSEQINAISDKLFKGVYNSATRNNITEPGVYKNDTTQSESLMLVAVDSSGVLTQFEIVNSSATRKPMLRYRRLKNDGTWEESNYIQRFETLETSVAGLVGINGTYTSSSRNSITSAGVYRNSSENNAALLIVSVYNSVVYQLEISNYANDGSSKIRLRSNNGGTWSSWNILVDSTKNDEEYGTITLSKSGESVLVKQGGHTYTLTRDINESKNLDTWRLTRSAFGSSVIWANIDIEGPVHEVGKSDLMGGYHGDEVMTEVKAYADGKSIDLTSAISQKCKTLDVFVKSELFHDGTSVKCFDRYKHLRFEDEKVIISNRIVCTEDGFHLGRWDADAMESVQNNVLNFYCTNPSEYACAPGVYNEFEAEYRLDRTRCYFGCNGFSISVRTLSPIGENHIGYIRQDSSERTKFYGYTIKDDTCTILNSGDSLWASFEIEIK